MEVLPYIIRMECSGAAVRVTRKVAFRFTAPPVSATFFAQRFVCSTLFARIPRVSALVLGQRGVPRRKRVMARRRGSARRLFSKAERKDTDEQLQRGCRRGLEGGAPWGGSPKQHPPSPPEAKHFEESKGFRQAGGALHPHHKARCKGDSPCLTLPRLERTTLPPQGRLPS